MDSLQREKNKLHQNILRRQELKETSPAGRNQVISLGFWSNLEKAQSTHIPTLSKYAKELFINTGLTDHKRVVQKRWKGSYQASMQISIGRGIYESQFERAHSHRKGSSWKKDIRKAAPKRRWFKYKYSQCQRRATLQVRRKLQQSRYLFMDVTSQRELLLLTKPVDFNDCTWRNLSARGRQNLGGGRKAAW